MKVGPSRKERLLWAFILLSKFSLFNLNQKEFSCRMHATLFFPLRVCMLALFLTGPLYVLNTACLTSLTTAVSGTPGTERNSTFSPKNTVKKADKSKLVQRYPNVSPFSLVYDKINPIKLCNLHITLFFVK